MRNVSERERYAIIAEWASGSGKITIADLARRHELSASTVSRIIKSDEALAVKAAVKSRAALDMEEFIASRTTAAQRLIDIILDTPEEELRSATLRDKMGAVKILTEAFNLKRESAPTSALPPVVINFGDLSAESPNAPERGGDPSEIVGGG